MAEVSGEQLHSQVLDGVGHLVFDNQRRRNALSLEMLAEIPPGFAPLSAILMSAW